MLKGINVTAKKPERIKIMGKHYVSEDEHNDVLFDLNSTVINKRYKSLVLEHKRLLAAHNALLLRK